MPSKENKDDEASHLLLERLNCLRKTNITLSKHSFGLSSSSACSLSSAASHPLPSLSRQEVTDDDDDDDDDDDNVKDSDLATRFLRLQNQQHYGNRNDKNRNVVATDNEDTENSRLKSLEEKLLDDAKESLSQDCGSDETVKHEKDESIVRNIEAHARELARVTVKRAIDEDNLKDDQAACNHHEKADTDLGSFTDVISRTVSEEEHVFTTSKARERDARDGHETNTCIARVMDELTVEAGVNHDNDNKNGEEEEENGVKDSASRDGSSNLRSEATSEVSSSEEEDEDDKESIVLPEAPSGEILLRSTATSSDTQEGKTQKGSKAPPLKGLSLPEAPSFAPIQRYHAQGSNNRTSITMYSDDDVDSWCVICNEDAKVKCLGCDGDLYCAECWHEGHMTREAGYEERGHKRVAYRKKR